MRFFISDLHFGHEKLSKLRGYSSVEEMDEDIILKWNSTVGKHDRIYLLGDLFLGKKNNLHAILERLKGHIVLIRGNHDTRYVIKKVVEFHPQIVEWIQIIKIMNKDVTLCHFPIEEWYRKERGSFHLHGHTHGRSVPSSRRMDVSFECIGSPISEEQVMEKLNAY